MAVASSRVLWPRLEIVRSDDVTIEDVTDWLASVEVELGDVSGIGTGATGGDGVVRQMRFRLHNETGKDRFSPLDKTSAWNEFNGAYDPLLWPNRQAIFYLAVQEQGAPDPVYPDDYFVLFQGYIGDEIRTRGPFVECELRDLAKRLQDTTIEEAKVYSESDFSPVEVVMQQIIDDHVTPNPPQIFIPSPISPAREVKAYRVEWSSVWDALQDLAAQSGLWLGYRFDPGTKEFRLTLLEPPRDKTAANPDFVLDWQDDFYVQELDITDRNVRNVAIVYYTQDVNEERKSVIATNPASIAEFGRRTLQIEEASTSIIKTAAAAQRLADFAVADLSDLTSTTRIDMPIRPEIDVFAGIVVTHPRLASENQFYGVESVRHVLDFEGGRFRTQVVCSGRVVGAHVRWMRMQARPGSAGDPTPDVWPVRPNTVLTVAAADAPEEVKRRADIVCDGLEDQIEIQAAIERATQASALGKVMLTEGTFHIADTILLPSNCHIQGAGNVTVLRVVDDAQFNFVFTTDDQLENVNIFLSDFSIDGNEQASGVVFESVTTFGLTGLRIFSCHTDGITLIGAFDGAIEGCIVRECVWGIWLEQAVGVSISACTIRDNDQDGIVLAFGSEHSVVGCTMAGNGGSGLYAVTERSAVTGNTIRDNTTGFWLDTAFATHNNVSDNTVSYNQREGIIVDGESNTVTDNNVSNNGLETPDTYDQIYVIGIDNELQGNVVRLGGDGGARYGIYVDPLAEDNYITNNDLKDAGMSGDLQDDGIGTVLEPGNRGSSGSLTPSGIGFRLARTSNYNIGPDDFFELPWDEAVFDTAGVFPGISTARITIPVTGLWIVGTHLRFGSNTTSVRSSWRIRIMRNVFSIAETVETLHGQEDFARSFEVSALAQLNAGDQIYVDVRKNASGNQQIIRELQGTPAFWGILVRSGSGGGSIGPVGPTPFARVRRNAPQSIPANVLTLVNFNELRFEQGAPPGTMWDPGQPSRLTAPENGLYHVVFNVQFTDVPGTKDAIIRYNGGDSIARTRFPAGGTGVPSVLQASSIYPMSAGDYVEAIVLTETAGDIMANNQYSPEFYMAKIGAI